MYIFLNGKEARTYPPENFHMFPKKGPSQKEISSSSNHYFSEDTFVFGVKLPVAEPLFLGPWDPPLSSATEDVCHRSWACRSEMPTSLVRALSPFLHVHRALVDSEVNFTRCFDVFLMACFTDI